LPTTRFNATTIHAQARREGSKERGGAMAHWRDAAHALYGGAPVAPPAVPRTLRQQHRLSSAEEAQRASIVCPRTTPTPQRMIFHHRSRYCSAAFAAGHAQAQRS